MSVPDLRNDFYVGPVGPPRPRRRGLGTRGAFWAAASVLALALWSSGAPSVVYPIYAEQWSLNPATITAVFATHQFALIVVLALGVLPHQDYSWPASCTANRIRQSTIASVKSRAKSPAVENFLRIEIMAGALA